MFPVDLQAEDRLVFSGMDQCRVVRKTGESQTVVPTGMEPVLGSGSQDVVFSASEFPEGCRTVVSFVKDYRGEE